MPSKSLADHTAGFFIVLQAMRDFAKHDDQQRESPLKDSEVAMQDDHRIWQPIAIFNVS
jgi:hypothetical protein